MLNATKTYNLALEIVSSLGDRSLQRHTIKSFLQIEQSCPLSLPAHILIALHIVYIYEASLCDSPVLDLRTLAPAHTRQQKTIYEASPIFPLCTAVGPKGNPGPRHTTKGYRRVFPYAPTSAHRAACHREARDGTCARPTVHTLGSRPKCVG